MCGWDSGCVVMMMGVLVVGAWVAFIRFRVADGSWRVGGRRCGEVWEEGQGLFYRQHAISVVKGSASNGVNHVTAGSRVL